MIINKKVIICLFFVFLFCGTFTNSYAGRPKGSRNAKHKYNQRFGVSGNYDYSYDDRDVHVGNSSGRKKKGGRITTYPLNNPAVNCWAIGHNSVFPFPEPWIKPGNMVGDFYEYLLKWEERCKKRKEYQETLDWYIKQFEEIISGELAPLYVIGENVSFKCRRRVYKGTYVGISNNFIYIKFGPCTMYVIPTIDLPVEELILFDANIRENYIHDMAVEKARQEIIEEMEVKFQSEKSSFMGRMD